LKRHSAPDDIRLERENLLAGWRDAIKRLRARSSAAISARSRNSDQGGPSIAGGAACDAGVSLPQVVGPDIQKACCALEDSA